MAVRRADRPIDKALWPAIFSPGVGSHDPNVQQLDEIDASSATTYRAIQPRLQGEILYRTPK